MKKFLMFSVVLVFLSGFQAFAYIPPSQFIVKGWVNKHAGLKQLKLKSTVTAFASEQPTSVHFKAITTYTHDGQKLKSWATDDSDKVLFTTEREASSMSPLSKLLFLSDLREVLKSLHATGVPLRTEGELMKLTTEVERRESEQESLVRWKGGVAWVLGLADSRQEPNSPQLWFEKDLFLPVRYLYQVASEGALYDIHLENYKFAREFPYPRTLSLHKAGAGTILTEQTGDPVVNSEIQSPKKILASGFTELGQAAPLVLRNLIQNYYDIVR